MSIDPVFTAALGVLLALLFALAVAHKLADLGAFRIVLHDYRVLPDAMVTPATAVVVITEVALALALPWPRLGAIPAYAAVGLLAVYSAGIAVNLLRGRRTLECGCAPSTYRQPLSEWLLLRNLALMAAAALLTFSPAERPLTWLDAVTVTGLVVAGAATWVAMQRLLAVVSASRLTPLRSPS